MKTGSQKVSAAEPAPVQVSSEDSKKELLDRLNRALMVIRDEDAFIVNQQGMNYFDHDRRLNRILSEMVTEQVNAFEDRSEK